ncbi:MAG: tripartite tricarboxylate transporter TctB family protein, partial [Candidatus Limnocylindria bacterium]
YVEGTPGPGFFPALSSVALSVTGALLVLMRVRKSHDQLPEFKPPSRSELWRALAVWGGVLASTLLMQAVGFLITMIGLVAVLLLGVERTHSMSAVITIVAVPLLAYLLFGVLLQVPLPAGPFGG